VRCTSLLRTGGSFDLRESADGYIEPPQDKLLTLVAGALQPEPASCLRH
jgi:hypothetical protein